MNRLLTIFIMMTICLTGQSQEVEDFVSGLLEQYPKARLLDIYKSCFQDYMGAEHLVADTSSARAYLEQELVQTRDVELMPGYYEPCGTGGRHVRVSLRAVHEGFITADKLLNAFVGSANAKRPTTEQWAELWHSMVERIDWMDLNLPHYDLDRQFIEQVLAQGKYAISHSPDYRETYFPHYRIVSREIFERDIKPLIPCPCCH